MVFLQRLSGLARQRLGTLAVSASRSLVTSRPAFADGSDDTASRIATTKPLFKDEPSAVGAVGAVDADGTDVIEETLTAEDAEAPQAANGEDEVETEYDDDEEYEDDDEEFEDDDEYENIEGIAEAEEGNIESILAEASENSFKLQKTGAVEPHEYADTYPDDFILQVFHHQQAAYRRYLEGVKDIEFPEDLSAKNVAQFAMEMENLKLKSGLPTASQIGEAKLAMATAESDNKMRQYLSIVTKETSGGPDKEYTDQVWQALEKVEKSHGPVLIAPDVRNEQAVDAYKAFMSEWKQIDSTMGWDDQTKERSWRLNETFAQYQKKLKEFIEDGEGEKDNVDSISASILERTSASEGEPKIPLSLFVHSSGGDNTESAKPAVP